MRRFKPSALSNPSYSYPGYHDGRMVRGFLYNMEKDAKKLQQVLTDEDDLPPWVSWKIYTAEDRLQAATRYMEREAILAKARKNTGEQEDFYSPTNVALVAAFLVLGGYFIRSRMESK